MSESERQTLLNWIVDQAKEINAPVQGVLNPDEESGTVVVKTLSGTLFGIQIFPVTLSITPVQVEKKSEKEEGSGKKKPSTKKGKAPSKTPPQQDS